MKDSPGRVTLDAATPATEAASVVKEALARSPALHVTGVEPANPRAYWDDVTERVGHSHDLAELPDGTKTGEKWMEIRFDPSIKNAYRHANIAQPLHTDGSYISDAPELIFFYCVNQAPSGGETIFLSGHRLVAMLDDADPGLLHDLRNTPVRFAKADDEKTRTVIDDAGDLTLTWNYHCAFDEETKPVVERFHRFLTTDVLEPDRVDAIRMQPGDGLFWWDERSLHGRKAFHATTADERFLWKTGIHLAA